MFWCKHFSAYGDVKDKQAVLDGLFDELNKWLKDNSVKVIGIHPFTSTNGFSPFIHLNLVYEVQ